MGTDEARNRFRKGSDIPASDSLGHETASDALIAATAALYAPAALTLATLAGRIVYANVRAMQLFGSSAAEFRSRDLSEFGIDPARMMEIEAVARDGRERQFRLSREIEGLGRRTFLCRVSRVAGRAGIPAWIALVAQELECAAEGDAGLTDSAILESYRTLSRSAVWRMPLDHPPADWRKNTIDCARERFALFGIRGNPAAPTAETFLDLVHVADRGVVYEAIETCLKGGGPFEVAYRLLAKLGHSAIVLTRGMIVENEESDGRSLWGVDIDLSAAVADDKIPFDKAAILDGLAAHFDGPLYAVDPQFRYIFFNETFSRNMLELYGAEAQLHGKAYEPAAASARRRVVMANIRRALSGVPVVEKVSVTLKDSGVVTFEVNYAPMILASQTRGVVVFGVKSA
jgi:hypothetical protein